MDQLRIITEQDFDQVAAANTQNYRTREAARAVLLDSDDQVYLLNVSLHHYHKLPGGGIDHEEDIETALMRELVEEVGCQAEIIAEVGKIIELRDFEALHQTSYCFLARQIGEQKDSALEEDELAEGMMEAKTKDIDEAIRILQQDQPNNIEGKFIRLRDLTFLEAAKELIENQKGI